MQGRIRLTSNPRARPKLGSVRKMPHYPGTYPIGAERQDLLRLGRERSPKNDAL